MNLEQQVCSLDLAKQLKELGVKQESLFYWENCYGELTISSGAWHDDWTEEWGDSHNLEDTAIASTFTVTELGENMGAVSEANITRAYGHVFNVPDTRFITATGLQDCMSRPDIGAKMLVYLIENKLITL